MKENEPLRYEDLLVIALTLRVPGDREEFRVCVFHSISLYQCFFPFKMENFSDFSILGNFPKVLFKIFPKFLAKF